MEAVCVESLRAPGEWPKIGKKWSNLNWNISVTTNIDEKKFISFDHTTFHLSHGHVHLFRLGYNFFFFYFYLLFNHKTQMDQIELL